MAILAYAKGPDGAHIAQGKTVTGFANVEEDYADHAVWSAGLLPRDQHVMPWRIEDRLKAIGANCVSPGCRGPGAVTPASTQAKTLARTRARAALQA